MSDIAQITIMPPYEDSLTVDEAAAILRVSVATVRRMCATGNLRARKVGRSWIIDGASLPRPAITTRSRRDSATSSLVDLPVALRQIKAQDLREDVWIPDILLYRDDLADSGRLLTAASDRVNGVTLPDPPVVVPVPKSPFFPRNAADLSLVDRIAYHSIIAAMVSAIEPQLSASVFSARTNHTGRDRFLRDGRDSWLAFRSATLDALTDGTPYMISTDITSYFDFIKHEILIRELQALAIDHRLIESLRRMLHEWESAPNTGIPQGPEASRVLGNFYLFSVDHVMNHFEGVQYFRYLDDIRLVGSSRRAVISALQILDSECRRRGLALSTKKTELLFGSLARSSLLETELDQLQYRFDSGFGDERTLRKALAQLFKRSNQQDGTINTRWARFSLYRLFRLRDRGVINQVLGNLENLAPLGSIVPRYLYPWLRQAGVQKKLTQFLFDPDRNTSIYLSSWLLAVMLDVADRVPIEWINYARRIVNNRSEPVFHRGLAINVLVLGRRMRDIEVVQEIVRTEHDPEMVRSALTALRRVDRLNKESVQQAARIPGMSESAQWLGKQAQLPSILFATKGNPIIRS